MQPASYRYFGRPVVEITQIASYGCRGRNGNRFGAISEHAFGNALDIAGFRSGRRGEISVVSGWWRGGPRERAFLQAVLAGACAEFYTVLGPGSDRHHYNHIHVDLLRSNAKNGRHYCQPSPGRGVPVAEGRARRSTTASVRPFSFVGPARGRLTEKLHTVAGSPRSSRARPSMIGESGRNCTRRAANKATAAMAFGLWQMEGRDGSRIVGADA